MKKLLFFFIPLLSTPAYPVSTPWESNPQGQVRLIAPYATTPQDNTITFGVDFKPQPGWMVYWKIPGDAGFPPKFDFKGSSGFTGPEILWPRPKFFMLPGNIREYGYDQEVVYPVRAKRTKTAAVHIVAKISYLTCRESCVPYKYTLTLDVPAGPGPSMDPPMETLLQTFINQVPPDNEDVLASLRPENPPAPLPAGRQAPAKGGPGGDFAWFILLAFIGGLILNVMPCVLPVLSIKLFGLLEHSGQDRRVIIRDTMASAAGIVVSFLIGGAIAVAAKEAGRAVGWGVQFQNPIFVAALAGVVTLFALNLWGVFEIVLPPALANLGAVAGHSEGVTPYFVSGILATLLATPCSAPFLGTAMGFALSQTNGVILASFLSAGLGMALPYFVLAAFPRTLRWLPKPGVWMVHVRVVLGFFLAATVVWLGFVLSSQVSAEGMAFFYVGLLGVSGIAWLKQILMTSQLHDARWAKLGIWVLLVIAFAAILGTVNMQRQVKPSALAIPGDLPWEVFDEPKIADWLKLGRPVFVDVTAEWCLTCKVNERFVLRDTEVIAEFKRHGVVMMRADWTNQDAVIGRYLTQHGRAGIPFYALYRPGQKPILLSEFLTKSQVLHTLQSE